MRSLGRLISAAVNKWVNFDFFRKVNYRYFTRGYRRLADSREDLAVKACWTCRNVVGIDEWACGLRGSECSYEPCYVKSEISLVDRIIGKWVGMPTDKTDDCYPPAATSSQIMLTLADHIRSSIAFEVMAIKDVLHYRPNDGDYSRFTLTLSKDRHLVMLSVFDLGLLSSYGFHTSGLVPIHVEEFDLDEPIFLEKLTDSLRKWL